MAMEDYHSAFRVRKRCIIQYSPPSLLNCTSQVSGTEVHVGARCIDCQYHKAFCPPHTASQAFGFGMTLLVMNPFSLSFPLPSIAFHS